MDSKMKAILDGTPDSPTRSKLEPYRELIRGLRQKRKTFPEIAQVLLANYNVHIHPSNIHRFVKVRSKQRPSQFEIPPDSSLSSAGIEAPSQFASAQSCSPPPAATAARKRFHFDPEEGLTLSDEVLNLKPKKD